MVFVVENFRGDFIGARERTRTSTTLRPLEPESSASASSATWAPGAMPLTVWRSEQKHFHIVTSLRSFVNAARPTARLSANDAVTRNVPVAEVYQNKRL